MSDIVVTPEDEALAQRILNLPFATSTNRTAPPYGIDRLTIAAQFVARHRIAARKQALEEAAKFAEAATTTLGDCPNSMFDYGRQCAAKAIRELGETK